jgi:hypothetical protein
MEKTVGIVLEELGDLASSIAVLLGHSPAGVVAQVAALVFLDAANVAHVVSAEEVAELQALRARSIAAGESAWRESHQDFVRRCVACSVTIRDCNASKQAAEGKACCSECNHPAP